MSIGWHFPSKEDGSRDGFNDSGIETFRGQPYASLAREVLQNSLDAKDDDSDKPVVVTFDLQNIPAEKIPGHGDLLSTMNKCLAESKSDKEKSFFEKAVKTLKGTHVPCLKIEDHYTTGLRGADGERDSQWYAITKMTGESAQKGDTAGGSYGIGKNAAFAVSGLRTVFYYTQYEEKGSIIEKMQGKSILMSVRDEEKLRQGIGYYGITEQCQPITMADQIPDELRRNEGEAGTTVLILGFDAHKTWAEEMAAVVLSNFFYAVHSGKLEVVIASSDKSFCIEQQGINDIFSQLCDEKSELHGKEEYMDRLNHAKAYLSAMTEDDSEYVRETENPQLGRCQLFINQRDGLPQKVGVMRNTGMLITENLPGLIRFRNMPDFAAVLICRATKGNALLRNMENPAHDKFEPERLSEEDRQEGKKALKSIATWVKEVLTDLLGETISEDATPIDELSAQFPNEEQDALAGEDRDIERGFDSPLIILPRPPKKPSYPSDEEEKKIGIGEDEDLDPNGDNPVNEPGEQYAPGKDNSKGVKTHLPMTGFKILQTNSTTNKVVFTPQFAGDALLDVYIAGDSDTEKVAIEKILHGKKPIKKVGTKFLLEACNSGKKVRLDIVFSENISYPLAIELTKKDSTS